MINNFYLPITKDDIIEYYGSHYFIDHYVDEYNDYYVLSAINPRNKYYDSKGKKVSKEELLKNYKDYAQEICAGTKSLNDKIYKTLEYLHEMKKQNYSFSMNLSKYEQIKFSLIKQGKDNIYYTFPRFNPKDIINEDLDFVNMESGHIE